MNQMKSVIKALIKQFFDTCSVAEPIENERDYRRVKKWTKKIRRLYTAFAIVALAEMFCLSGIVRLFEIPVIFTYTVVPFTLILTNFGYATLIVYLPRIVKGIVKSGRVGYDVGKNIETTHVSVSHEFGNTYKVSSYTDNKGCLFAVIGGTAKLLVWLFFCVYIGPFLTFKKYKKSMENLKQYKIA